jgi:hypothetical protein
MVKKMRTNSAWTGKNAPAPAPAAPDTADEAPVSSGGSDKFILPLLFWLVVTIACGIAAIYEMFTSSWQSVAGFSIAFMALFSSLGTSQLQGTVKGLERRIASLEAERSNHPEDSH